MGSVEMNPMVASCRVGAPPALPAAGSNLESAQKVLVVDDDAGMRTALEISFRDTAKRMALRTAPPRD